jgi:hypothetical protein
MKPACTHRFRPVHAVPVIMLCLAAAHGWAGAMDDAEDIRDKPIDKAQRKLEGRGYEIVQSSAAQGLQYWWNRDQESCLALHIKNGQVTHAEVNDERTCRSASKQTKSLSDSQPTRPAQQGISSLIGMRASYLDAEMESRGFQNKGGYQDAGAAHGMWWNRSTRECLSVVTREGRVETVEIIQENNCN